MLGLCVAEHQIQGFLQAGLAPYTQSHSLGLDFGPKFASDLLL